MIENAGEEAFAAAEITNGSLNTTMLYAVREIHLYAGFIFL